MILKSELLTVDFGELCFPMHYAYQPADAELSGASASQTLKINSDVFPLSSLNFEWEDATAHVKAGAYAFDLRYQLSGGILSCDVVPAVQNIQVMDFSEITLLLFDDTYSYMKDKYWPGREWDSRIGRGLLNCEVTTSSVIDSFPEEKERCLHACGYNGKFCAFVRSGYAVRPIATRLYEHEKYPARSGAYSIGVNRMWFDLVDVKFDHWDFSVNFTGDLNGDQVVDGNDFQLALREYLTQKVSVYNNAYVYKILCDTEGNRFTTFDQVLEIVRYISAITHNRKQIVYLVGWQHEGHDTGFPSFNKVNARLGTADDLRRIMKEAAEKYNAVITVHTNVDDSYREHPGYNDDVISKDPAGNSIPWEVFGNKQSYHINHTKDFRCGGFQKRVDELFDLLPLKESVHFDAFRMFNFSWEKDEFIGEDKEWYCGIVRDQEYVHGKGCDITIESNANMPVEHTTVFSYYFHETYEPWPVLHHQLLQGGGNGITVSPLPILSEYAYNFDVVYEQLGSGKILDATVMAFLLRYYLLQRKMIYNNISFGIGKSIFEDGTVAEVNASYQYFSVKTGDVQVADYTSRFIPLEDGIYIYQQKEGTMVRNLPKDYQNIPLKLEVFNGGSSFTNYTIVNNKFMSNLPPKTLVILKKA